MIFLQKFLFLYKSKYRRKWMRNNNNNNRLCKSGDSCCFLPVSMPPLPSVYIGLCYILAVTVLLKPVLVETLECGGGGGENSTSVPSVCLNGDCVNNLCVCHHGWIGPQCQYCFGKIKVDGDRGWISDGLGNYTANMKCTWLIQSSPNNQSSSSPIFLRIQEFATECGWDHLYIYDGDNVHAPLLGVFSGILVQNNYNALRFPELVAESGSALLHFYTDVAYNLTGFNITYRSHSCPSNDSKLECSGNGVCVDGTCTCNAPYDGTACNVEKCPKNCSNHGICDMEKHKCRCDSGFKGRDCSHSQDAEQGYWEVISPDSTIPSGSASHSAVIYNNSLWVFGGNRLILDTKDPISINRFDFKANTWETVQAKGDAYPPSLYGHSCVAFEGKVYLYGGVQDGKFGNRHVSSSVWSFDLSARKWSEVVIRPEKCKRGMCGSLELAGHTAVVINEKGNKSRHSRMVVISGHSPRYGYVNVVQEFHFVSTSWNIIVTKGYPFSGSYGHSSNWDPVTQKIYVFGGYQIGLDSTSAYLSSALHTYDPSSHTWHLLERGPQGRFLHATVIYKGLYFVFGGNGHNDTTYSLGSKCFTSEVLVYDITCDSWSTLDPPEDLPADISRYGHSVINFQNSLVIYGGFNGLIQNDLIRFTPTNCSIFTSQKDCLSSVKRGVKCMWNKTQELCENFATGIPKEKDKDIEREKDFNVERCLRDHTKKVEGEACSSFPSCSACLQNKFECVWCGSNCQYSKCKDSRHKPILSLEQCKGDDSICGHHLYNCPLCTTEINCMWGKDERCVRENISYRNPVEGTAVADREQTTCELSCAGHSTCSNCTSNNCMWCNNLSLCVDKNAYVISFPYGQCMSWSQMSSACLSKDVRSVSTSFCNEVASCDTCLALPSCGWCDDGLGTGLGRCMDGSSRGPLVVNSTGAFLNTTLCPSGLSTKWHFTNCPACQCNGHTSCNENNQCIECKGFTEGDHCEKCIQGYYGQAVNGGKCKPCECNGQAEVCHTETGRCFCTTKGITGEDCGRCDTQNNYSGDPSNSSCFYDLQIDYQFTFNLSKKEDRHFTKINFRNTPTKHDIDADFQITCSMMAKMNISYTKGGLPETFIIKSHNCSTFKYRFSKTEFSFGSPDNITFYVYVYDFHPPLWIQISFSQSPKLDLLHFFITFSTCFLVLLLVAAVLWKIKQKYDMYRRRQRLFVEMEQMASRPFAQVYVEVGRSHIPSRLASLRKRRKEWPSPIALEPCNGNRAAILSLLVSLPTGSQQFAPPGQSGFSIASTLVALGNPRKISFEPMSKVEGKNNKIRKSLPSHSLNTCI